MIILTIRTDKPEAEVGIYSDRKRLSYEIWHAHRELSVTLLQKIAAILAEHDLQFSDIGGIVAYQGPGSFTGLRIGLSVANGLAYGLNEPIVAMQGEAWITEGIERLFKGERDAAALPEYGAPVHITQQRK